METGPRAEVVQESENDNPAAREVDTGEQISDELVKEVRHHNPALNTHLPLNPQGGQRAAFGAARSSAPSSAGAQRLAPPTAFLK